MGFRILVKEILVVMFVMMTHLAYSFVGNIATKFRFSKMPFQPLINY